jgi:hypothetical protein
MDVDGKVFFVVVEVRIQSYIAPILSITVVFFDLILLFSVHESSPFL